MKIKIRKIEERPDAEIPDNIETGFERIYNVVSFMKPKVGKCFQLSSVEKYFTTSTVTEILDENTFKTRNSIYRWGVEE